MPRSAQGSGPQQLALDLGHRPALDRADFLVTATNQEAVGWIDRWPDWPHPFLALYGPAESGKSHLAAVFAARAGAEVLHGAELSGIDPAELAARCKAVAVDEADQAPAEPLLHLYNCVREAGDHLLLVGRDAPARWPVSLPDLKSRLATVPAVAIRSPDDDTIAAVLVKLFRDRQLMVGPDVISYLVSRMPRTFAAAAAVAEAADRESLAAGRKVTVPLMKTVLTRLPETE